MSFTDIERRFWFHIDRRGPDECWPPHGTNAVEKNKYAQFNMGKAYGYRRVTTARMALMLKLGRDLLPKLDTCHTCHWKPCANPAHLFEGTRAQNLAMRTKEAAGAGGRASRGVKKRDGTGEKKRLAQLSPERMRTCECGITTNAGAMAGHRKKTGCKLVTG